jgi:hypothetical protein
VLADSSVFQNRYCASAQNVGGKLKDDQTLPTNSDFSTKQTMTVEKYFQSFY